MSKHASRIAKLKVLEPRARTMARLTSDGKALEKRADKLAVEIAVLQRSTMKRAREHRGDRPPPKAERRHEYEELLLKLRRMPDAARISPTPLIVRDEAERLQKSLDAMAKEIGLKNPDPSTTERILARTIHIVRVRTENTPEQIRTRAFTWRQHSSRSGWRSRCYCPVCESVRTGHMTIKGVFIERKER